MVGDLAAQSMDGEHLAGIVADLLDKRLAVLTGTATGTWKPEALAWR